MKQLHLITIGLVFILSMSCCSSSKSEWEITPPLTEAIQQYDELGPFHQGLAMVVKNGKYGYIDYNGKEVIPCQYEEARNFSDSRAIVKKGGRYGCIDTNGREIIPFKYSLFMDFVGDYAVVYGEKGLRGCVDKDGNEIIPCNYTYVSSFSEDLALVVKNESLFGFVDKQGKEVIPCEYENANSFSEGLAVIKKDGLYGFIDKQGKEVIPCKYTYAHSFSEGLAAVEKTDTDGLPKGGYIDSKGNEVIPCIYNVANGMHSFSNGIAVVMDEQGFLGGIDTKGKEILPFVYGDIQVFKDRLLAREATLYEYKLFDKDGNAITTPSYDKISFTEYGWFMVIKDGKLGIMDEGKTVVEPKYNVDWSIYYTPFVDGISVIGINGKYGAINQQGGEIIPFIYDNLQNFSEGLALAKIADKWGYVDKKGNTTFTQKDINVAIAEKENLQKEIKTKEDEQRKLENPSWIDGEWNFEGDVYYEGLVAPLYANERIIVDYASHTVKYYSKGKLIYDGTFDDKNLRYGLLATGQIKNTNRKLIADIDHDKKLLKYNDNLYFTKVTSNDENPSNNLEDIPDWLQGEWVLNIENPYGKIADHKMVIDGHQLIYYKNNREVYRGGFTYYNNQIKFDNQSFDVNTSSQVIKYSFYKFTHISGGSIKADTDVSFNTSSDVMSYVVGKTFYGHNTRVKIDWEGLYLNGNRQYSGAPQVIRFSYDKAVIKISLIPHGDFYITVLPHEGRIVDNGGVSYYLR